MAENEDDDIARAQLAADLEQQAAIFRDALVKFAEVTLAGNVHRRTIAIGAVGDYFKRLLQSDAAERPATVPLSLALLSHIGQDVVEAADAAAVIPPSQTRH